MPLHSPVCFCRVTSMSWGTSLDGSGGNHLVVLRPNIFGHKGVGANPLVVAQVQQRQHHPLVLLGQVGEHKGVRGSLQQQQNLSLAGTRV